MPPLPIAIFFIRCNIFHAGARVNRFRFRIAALRVRFDSSAMARIGGGRQSRSVP
jgi:hypothetical protein